LLALESIESVDVDLGRGAVTVDFSDSRPTVAELRDAVSAGGFTLVGITTS